MRIRTHVNFNSVLFLASFLIIPGLITAQQRFGAGIVAGLTAFQIDGDQSAGFNKLGLQAGIRGTTRVGKKNDVSICMLFEQRGSQSQLVKDQYTPYFSFTLNYIDIPVQFHLKDWLVEYEDARENYYRVSLNAGFSYARLLGYKFNGDPNGMELVAQDGYVKKSDLSFLVGGNFFFSRHFGIGIQYNHSLYYSYDPRGLTHPPLSKAWISYGLLFQGIYMF